MASASGCSLNRSAEATSCNNARQRAHPDHRAEAEQRNVGHALHRVRDPGNRKDQQCCRPGHAVHESHRQRAPAKPVLALIFPVPNLVAGVGVLVNELDPIAVPVERHAVAPQTPQDVGSKADKHDADRGFEGLCQDVGDSPTQHDRSACE